MLRIISTLFLQLLCIYVIAGNVTINGVAHKSYIGKKVKAVCFTDYISEQAQELTSCEISAKGEFTLSFKTDATKYIMLRIQNCEATMYVEPDKNYYIGVYQKDSAEVESFSRYTPIEIGFVNTDSLELNYLIYDYLEKYDGFLSKMQGWKMSDNAVMAARTDTFCKKIKAKYATVNNKYFQNFIQYTLGALQLNFRNELYVYENYIKSKNILFAHREYVSFLKIFLDRIVGELIKTEDLVKEVNNTSGYESLSAFFTKSKIMLNDSLRNISMLYTLKLCYANPNYKRERVIDLLNDMSKKTELQFCKSIASNLATSLGKMQVGSAITDFTFYDFNNNKISLTGYKDKYLYVAFFKPYCKTCEEEIKVVAEHQKKFGAKINFLYILMDNFSEKIKEETKLYPKQGITYVYSADWMAMKEYFEIMAIPAYVLISPDGKIKISPAINPGIDLEKLFAELTKKK
jgi:thiol-disulfide isomerase/thioredoxin